MSKIKEKKYYAYMLRCKDNSIYSGYTTDLEKRVETHNIGKGAKYTRNRRPVKLEYYEEFKTKTEALKREREFKKYTHKEKENIILKKGIKMKIAIISDIHGNLEALKATLKDIEKRKVDKIICLGDIIAKGVHPKECIKLIRKKCDIVLQGNCDSNFSAKHEDINELPEQEQKRIKWNQSLISEEDREYLSNLPFCYEFYMSGSLVRLFHATPTVNNKAITNLDKIETKYKMFLPSKNTISQDTADVIIYGHIHHPYMDKIYNKTLINVGSVGNSFDVIRNDNKDGNVLETTKSNYLIIEGEFGSKEYNSEIAFQFIKVPYNIDKELKDENLNIEKENYRFELTKGRYRNMEKINKSFKELGIDIDNI